MALTLGQAPKVYSLGPYEHRGNGVTKIRGRTAVRRYG
jgi:hypothetical protein